MNDRLLDHPVLLNHPVADAPPWARVTAVSPDLWRVADPRGRVMGHVRTVLTERGWRFCVERFDSRTRGFRRLGEFWRPGEALDCLRHLT